MNGQALVLKLNKNAGCLIVKSQNLICFSQRKTDRKNVLQFCLVLFLEQYFLRISCA